jgi:hypothetical protein
MKNIILCILLNFLLFITEPAAAARQEWTDDDRKKEKNQIALWKVRIVEAKTLNGSEKLSLLRLGIKNFGFRKSIEGHNQEIDEVFHEMQEIVLSLPDHANYFRKTIKDARATCVIENERSGRIHWGDYDNARSSAIATLELLPSPEVVCVLVELLADTEETSEQITLTHTPDAFGPAPNANLAVGALKKLIENPPATKFKDVINSDAIQAWQNWSERIKAGDLTFRFKNNPTEYDFNGPAPKEKLQRIAHDQQRDESRMAGHAKIAPKVTLAEASLPSSNRLLLPALFGLGVLIATSAWYFLRRQGSRKVG